MRGDQSLGSQPCTPKSNIFIVVCLNERVGAARSRLGPGDEVREALVARALHLLDLRAVLVDLEGGHAIDAGGLGGLRVRIHIDLLHDDLAGILLSFLREDGPDALAGRAPRSREVNDEGLSTGSRRDRSIEGGLVREHQVVCHFLYV